MIPKEWNKDSYNEFCDYLKKIGESKYRDFSKGLSFTKYEMLGIRIPDLRKIGKEIYKNSDYKNFLKFVTDSKYFEIIMIEGQVIANIKDENEFYNYFIKYIEKIDDWSLCDVFCNSIKIVRKYEEKYFDLALKLSLDSKEFVARIGQIIILNHFINKKNLNKILKNIDSIKSDKYYVNMASAWLLCELYINYPHEIKDYLLKSKVNNFTFNKAISKIRESFRVSKNEKDYLNTLKRK